MGTGLRHSYGHWCFDIVVAFEGVKDLLQSRERGGKKRGGGGGSWKKGDWISVPEETTNSTHFSRRGRYAGPC